VIHLLNLLAAIALLVWGTHIVRTGMLRVFGEEPAPGAGRSFGNRFTAGAGRPGRDQPGAEQHRHLPDRGQFVGSGLVGTGARWR
jgi:phosphate:Na+ symporter